MLEEERAHRGGSGRSKGRTARTSAAGERGRLNPRKSRAAASAAALLVLSPADAAMVTTSSARRRRDCNNNLHVSAIEYHVYLQELKVCFLPSAVYYHVDCQDVGTISRSRRSAARNRTCVFVVHAEAGAGGTYPSGIFYVLRLTSEPEKYVRGAEIER